MTSYRLIRAAALGAILAMSAAAAIAAEQPATTTAGSETSKLFTGFQGKSKDPIQIDASSLEISETTTQRIAVFEGNVTVRRGDTVMTAAKMTVFSNKDAPLPGVTTTDTAPATGTPPATKTSTAAPVKTGSAAKGIGGKAGADAPPPFTRIEATGGVRVTSAQQILTGDNAIVDMPNHTITLDGGVILSQGTNVITGQKLIIDTQSGKARIEQLPSKQIRAVFTPSEATTPPAKAGGTK